MQPCEPVFKKKLTAEYLISGEVVNLFPSCPRRARPRLHGVQVLPGNDNGGIMTLFTVYLTVSPDFIRMEIN